jgi:putative holliday junction resolvase
MRVLALDYGSSRCGCAVSDASGTIVTPIEPILRPASKRGFQALRRLAAEREADVVLVGLPLGLDGGETDQTRETRAFAERLSRGLGEEIPVEMYDERFTTKLAKRTGSANGSSEDSRAAAHLLESWLTAQAR